MLEQILEKLFLMSIVVCFIVLFLIILVTVKLSYQGLKEWIISYKKGKERK